MPDDIFANCNIPPDVQLNLKELIKKHPDGIWASQLENKYRNKFGVSIPYKDCGFGSLEHMCSEITYILQYAKHFKGDFKLYPVNKKVPMGKIILSNEDLAIPRSIVKANEIIPVQKLPAITNIISIWVSQTYDPSKFWFHTNDSVAALKDIMNRLQLFYGSTGEYYQFPTYKLRKGIYCVALFQRQYHRAIIADILPQLMHSVKVYYIDYGTVETVNTNNVFYLHESFKAPNAFALRGRLALAQPKDLKMPWSTDAITIFDQLVTDVMIQAKIEAWHKEDERSIYNLKLGKKQQSTTSFIHDQLITNHLAVSICDAQDPKEAIPEFAAGTQFMHLVPTFKDIEEGVAPTRTELIALTKIGYPITKILGKYIT